MSGSCYIGRPAMHSDHPEGPMVCVYPCMMPNQLLRLVWDDQRTTAENYALISAHLSLHGEHRDTCVFRNKPI